MYIWHRRNECNTAKVSHIYLCVRHAILLTLRGFFVFCLLFVCVCVCVCVGGGGGGGGGDWDYVQH